MSIVRRQGDSAGVSSQMDLLALLYLALKKDKRRKKKQKKKRECWVHPILQRRDQLGEYRLTQEMRYERPADFFTYFRMTPEKFDELLSIVGPLISKQTTAMRKPIPPNERLAITLRFLATGDSFQTIAFSYRCGKSTVVNLIRETCVAIWQALAAEYMPEPTQEQWIENASQFKDKWNFPNCIGSIDGKHVVLQKPAKSGSLYFNYKKTFSIVLMAVVDAQRRFIAVDIGQYGRVNDSRCFSNSNFGKRLSSGQLDLPSDAPLPGCVSSSPHVFVADEAFPLQRHIMRPFPGTSLNCSERRHFNFRLSRARNVVENAFGILSSRFRMFRRPLAITPANTDHVVKACTVLHNYLSGDQHHLEFAADEGEGPPAQPAPHWQSLARAGRRSSEEATRIRNDFVGYFNSQQGAYVPRH